MVRQKGFGPVVLFLIALVIVLAASLTFKKYWYASIDGPYASHNVADEGTPYVKATPLPTAPTPTPCPTYPQTIECKFDTNIERQYKDSYSFNKATWHTVESHACNLSFKIPDGMGKIGLSDDLILDGPGHNPKINQGSDFYDGIWIDPLEISDSSLDMTTFVDNIRACYDSSIESEQLTDSKQLTIGRFNGIQYETKLWTRKTFVTKLPNGKYLKIDYILDDPNKQNFEQMFEDIVSSIKIAN